MELERGTVTDRPWGMTLGALGRRGFTGQLTLTDAQGRTYAIAFDHGAIVSARSPLPGDAATRIAAVNQLVPVTLQKEMQRRITSQPDRDDIDVVVETARLSIEQT